MNRSKRKTFVAPVAALLLIGGAAALGPLMSLGPGAHTGMSPVPGFIWCAEHQDWHEDPDKPKFDPLRIGPITPPGKVWVREHGHFHDLPPK